MKFNARKLKKIIAEEVSCELKTNRKFNKRLAEMGRLPTAQEWKSAIATVPQDARIVSRR